MGTKVRELSSTDVQASKQSEQGITLFFNKDTKTLSYKKKDGTLIEVGNNTSLMNEIIDFQNISYKSKELTLSSADLLALPVTPIDVLPAPGADKYYDVKYAIAYYKFGTTAYLDGNNSELTFTNSNMVNFPISLILAAGNRMSKALPLSGQTLSENINQPIQFTTDDNVAGFPNTGDGTLIIKLWYTIESV